MRGASWALAIVLLPLAAATTPCECRAMGEAQDVAGDAPTGSDIVGLQWGKGLGEIVIDVRGGIHTDLSWQVVLWTYIVQKDGEPRESLNCFTVRPGGVEWQESARPPSASTCPGDAHVRNGSSSIRGGDALVIPMAYGGSAIHPDHGTTCSMLHAQVWRGDELLDETEPLPARAPPAGSPCPGSTKVDCTGHCDDLFFIPLRVEPFLMALGLVALLVRRAGTAGRRR